MTATCEGAQSGTTIAGSELTLLCQAEYGVDLPGIKTALQAVQSGRLAAGPASPMRQGPGTPGKLGSATPQQRLAQANSSLQRGLSQQMSPEESVSPTRSAQVTRDIVRIVLGSELGQVSAQVVPVVLLGMIVGDMQGPQAKCVQTPRTDT